MNIGSNIKKYRKEKNLTQQQLAYAINKSKSTIEKYEANNIENIPFNTLKSIATALEIPLASLCNLNIKSASHSKSSSKKKSLDKKTKIAVDREILIFAFRYSLGRMSYAPFSVTRAIEDNIDNISSGDIKLYLKEINECESYGMDFDKEHWLNFAEYLEKVLKDREAI